MARTACTVTDLTKATQIDVAADDGVALDATNNHVLTVAAPLDSYIIKITNTTASEKVATIKAGDNPPADAAGQGDLEVTLAAGDSTATMALVTGLESARFIQNDGTVLIDLAASMTGYIEVWRVLR